MQRSLRLILSSLVILAVSGCANRLSGPLHLADGPPWIAAELAEPSPEATVSAAFEVRHRIILIGDTGYYLEDDPTLAALDEWAIAADSSSVLFLGDNIYNEGLTDEDREHGENILSHQLAATQAHKIFIPGNHDWGLLPKNQNATAIRNQQVFVDEWPGHQAEFIPKDGCMGPVQRTLLEGSDDQRAVIFIALDPTPWINSRLREDCPIPQTQDEFLEELDRALAAHAKDFVIVGSHYPMLTGGPHGGLTYGFLADMIITPIGWMIGGLANTYEPEYADWISRTQAVLRRNPPDIYAAGHDHSLQLLESGDVAGLYVVSGAGAVERVSTVTHLPETLFAHAAPGFVVVDIGQTKIDEQTIADSRSNTDSLSNVDRETNAIKETVIIRVIESGIPGSVFEMPLPSGD